MNSLDADLVVLGGDYVHRGLEYLEPAFSELPKLWAPLGVFGVLGNHDYWEGAGQARRAARNAGIRLLENDAVWVTANGARFKLGGVADFWAEEPVLEPTVRDTTDSDLVIIVSHNPDYAEELRNAPVDLVLSGHTHGGQVTFFGLWAPLVTNGVGTITPCRALNYAFQLAKGEREVFPLLVPAV